MLSPRKRQRRYGESVRKVPRREGQTRSVAIPGFTNPTGARFSQQGGLTPAHEEAMRRDRDTEAEERSLDSNPWDAALYTPQMSSARNTHNTRLATLTTLDSQHSQHSTRNTYNTRLTTLALATLATLATLDSQHLQHSPHNTRNTRNTAGPQAQPLAPSLSGPPPLTLQPPIAHQDCSLSSPTGFTQLHNSLCTSKRADSSESSSYYSELAMSPFTQVLKPRPARSPSTNSSLP